MDALRVHRINFFTPEPTAIHSLAYDESISRLAVSRIMLPFDKSNMDDEERYRKKLRVDSSIEIWDVSQKPFLEKKIPSAFNHSVEVISWCNGRLFSVNMHGTLNEYDLNTLKSKYSIPVASGCPLYCLSVNKQMSLIATGNEDGHIVLYQITTYGVEYEKKFDRQEGRILCLDWHESGEVIATGSIDAIRVWNVLTGQVVVRIIVGRETRNTETFVWCLAITRDMTVISGDSRGKTCFWDGNTGTLLSCLGTHKADVFAMALLKDENTVYTSGVDPKIISFVKSEVSSKDGVTQRRWMKCEQRVAHTHDVRALQMVGEYLVSGGIDCNLVFTKYPPKTCIKFFPFSQVKYCSVASKAACILLMYPRFVEVWKLGSSLNETGGDGERLLLQELPKKVAKFSTNELEIITCSSISSDGQWVAYSSLLKIRLFHIEQEIISSVPVLQKVVLPESIAAAYNLLFTSSDNRLIVYDKTAISVIKCDKVKPELLASAEQESSEARLFELSPNDAYLACGHHNGNIVLYNLEDLKLFCELPQYTFQATALKFDATTEHLFVVYSDRKIIEYNLMEQRHSGWSNSSSFHEFQTSSFYPVTNIVFKNEKILLQDESSIYIMKKTKTVSPIKKQMKSGRNANVSENDREEVKSLKIVDRYQHVSSIHSIVDDLIVIEITQNDILNVLPPPLRTKKYGT